LAARSDDIAAARSEALTDYFQAGTRTVGHGFESLYAQLEREYRSEYFFKNAIVSKVVFGRHSPRTTSALLELPMGNSYADIVILNGTTTTYEIKTDLDHFGRLGSQLRDYSSRTEYVYVVTSEARAAAAERSVLPHVGVLVLRRNGALATAKTAESNIGRLDADHLFRMLRVGEARNALLSLGFDVAQGPAARTWPRMRAAFNALDQVTAHQAALQQLKGRSRHLTPHILAPTFPVSLRAAVYETALSAAAVSRLTRRLGTALTA
jgi:hypothetical protein